MSYWGIILFVALWAAVLNMYSEKGPNLSTAVEVFILILTLVLVFLPSPCEASPAPTHLQSSRIVCECGNTLRYIAIGICNNKWNISFFHIKYHWEDSGNNSVYQIRAKKNAAQRKTVISSTDGTLI